MFRFVIHEPYAHGNPYNVRKLNFLPAGTICPCNNNNNNNNNCRKNITRKKKQLLVHVLVLLLRYYLDRFYFVHFFQPLNIRILHFCATPRIHHHHHHHHQPTHTIWTHIHTHTRSRARGVGFITNSISVYIHIPKTKKKTKYTFIYNVTYEYCTQTSGHSCPTIFAKMYMGPAYSNHVLSIDGNAFEQIHRPTNRRVFIYR